MTMPQRSGGSNRRRQPRPPVPSQPQPFLDIVNDRINEREGATMAQQPLSAGLTGLSRDGAILAEVLKQLAAIQEALTHVAQKDDLKEFVRQDQFSSQQVATSGRFDDHAARLTKAETKIETLQEKLHQSELTDAQKFGALSTLNAQQLGQAQQFAGQQLQAVQSTAMTTQTKVLYALVSIFGGALFSLISALIMRALIH